MVKECNELKAHWYNLQIYNFIPPLLKQGKDKYWRHFIPPFPFSKKKKNPKNTFQKIPKRLDVEPLNFLNFALRRNPVRTLSSAG
jgi:hypothetical protein